MPEWYPTLRAARWLGVPPWELTKQSKVWEVWANVMEEAHLAANHPDFAVVITNV